MPYSPDLVAQIRRLHFHEHYSIHAVSQVVKLHRDTVKRLLYGDDTPESEFRRARIIDPYLETISEHLNQYPSIRGKTLFQILKDRGFQGSYNSVLRAVRPLRRKAKKSFKPMQVFKGEQGQVDWAHFGSLAVEGGSRKLYLFAMVLSWSRAIFAKFTFDSKTDSFLRLHEEAFQYFGGSPRHILYDNLKSAVSERYRDTIKLNPQLIEFSGFYGYQPRICKPYAGNQKGRVERAIRFIRDSFASGYTFTDIDSANVDLRNWIEKVANERQWPDNKNRQVKEAFKDESEFLLKLQERRIEPCFASHVRSNKCSLVRFDLNDYSIPWDYTRETLRVEADDFEVRFLNEGKLIASHKRSWDRGQRVTKDEHWQEKPATGVNVMDDLITKFPSLDTFYRELVDRGEPLRTIKPRMVEIYKLHGEKTFSKALRIARKRAMYHPSQITRIIIGLEREGKASLRAGSVAVPERFADFDIRSHDLDQYDTINPNQESKK